MHGWRMAYIKNADNDEEMNKKKKEPTKSTLKRRDEK